MSETAEIIQFPDRRDDGQAPAQQSAGRSPQVEDGYTRIANDLLDALCMADFTSREFRVVNFVIRQTYGWNDKAKRMSSTFIAKGTGLHETDCSKVLNELIRRQVITRHGGSRSPVSLNKHYEQWVSSETRKKSPPTKCPESGQDALAQSGQDALAKKDRKDMNTPSNEGERTGEPERGSSGGEKSQPRLPACPHMEILDLWAEIMPDKRQHSKTMWHDSKRAAALAARWKMGFTRKHADTGKQLYTTLEEGIDWWGRFFRYLRRNEFLMRDHRWFDLSWVCNRENFIKILERNYEEGGQ
ncbi:replication protein [Bisbaumannia pacifica]|uniref:Replication protein n=1 Tax=Bisbaumannia pacifica TaxID=77098 RepID=A0ABD4KXI0_9GAMM|nr:replication protein [Halomonas pacifica]MBH8578768.1 replication protein [Halomonas pacifica]